MKDSAFDAEVLRAFLCDALDTVEDVHHALAPGLHGTFGAPVYRRVRASAATAAHAVSLSPRLSAASTRVLSGATVRWLAGVTDGILGAPKAARPTDMTVRVAHRRVALDRESLAAAFPSASGRVVVFLHGLIETERWWFHRPAKNRTGTDFGSRLAEDLPCTPVYVRYHSGRPIATNGASLVTLLTDLITRWPVPVTEVVLVGHSMGGLVAREAVLAAHRQHAPWLRLLTRVASLGTPFTGAPLESAAERVATACQRVVGLRPLGRLLALRSDGIKDLAAASREDAWPDGVREYRLGATITRSTDSRWGRVVGDLVVPSSRPGTSGPTVEHACLGGLHHLDLLHHDSAYEALLTWLSGDREPARVVA